MEHFVVQPVKTGTNLVISTLMLILLVWEWWPIEVSFKILSSRLISKSDKEIYVEVDI